MRREVGVKEAETRGAKRREKTRTGRKETQGEGRMRRGVKK